MKFLMKIDQKVIWVLKALLMAYFITGIFLMVLALLLFKLQLSEEAVNIGIMVIYILATLLSGIYMGKKFKSKKFLWGFAAGFAYFVILLLVSLLVNRGLDGSVSMAVTTLFLCALSGTFGGMLA